MNALEETPTTTRDVVMVRGLSKRFGSFTAIDDVSFAVRENTIYGLLGRNGAGKTTLMRLLTGQARPTAGTVEIFGGVPFENAAVVERICFVSENQVYPDGFRVSQVLAAGKLLFPRWDAAFAESLAADFGLPPRRPVKKLSRGMLSALGIVVGLASQAPLTLFDEPYLGLDAVARQLFYDRLLCDYAERPRTILLSTHLIDEVSDLIEHVLLIERGRIAVDDDAERLRGRAVTVSGAGNAVEEFAADRQRLHSEKILGQSRVTVLSRDTDPERAQALGLRLEPLTLQQLVVRTAGLGEHAVNEIVNPQPVANGASR
jgi:ABC-2 type transport system ATP-binding protein